MITMRPGGMSDDDSDDDWDDLGDNYPRRRGHVNNNGGPKSICQALLLNNITELQKSISVALDRNLSLNYDALTKEIPLILACLKSFVEGVKLLLASGADPNIAREMTTPLAICCTNSSIDSQPLQVRCVELLLEYGADVNIKSNRGQVPLIIAVENNSIEVVKVLLKATNIDINAVDPNGRTALFYAAENGCNEMFDLLVAAGINVNAKDRLRKVANDLWPTSIDDSSACLDDVKVASLFQEIPTPDHCHRERSSNEVDNTLINNFLANLPNADGLGGFGDLVPNILVLANLPDLKIPGTQLPDLLSGSEETLNLLGIKLSHHRQNILKAVHRFHTYRWNSSSLIEFKNISALSTEFLGQVISNILLHTVTMRCTLSYLDDRIEAFASSPKDSNFRRDLIVTYVDLYTEQANIKNKLEAVLRHVKKIQNLEDAPVDFIGRNKFQSRRAFKLLSTSISIFSATCFYFMIKRFS